MRICSVKSCNKKHYGKGYCATHYRRWTKYKDPLYVKKILNRNRDPICTIDGCNNKHDAMGFCHVHYRRFKKSGNPLFRKTESHKMRKTPEYMVWTGIKTRCFNSNDKAYKDYGGRGITTCEKWKNSFIAFYEDMGERPFPEAQIDRRDNDGNYEPENCRWVTPKVNANNRRPMRKNVS